MSTLADNEAYRTLADGIELDNADLRANMGQPFNLVFSGSTKTG